MQYPRASEPQSIRAPPISRFFAEPFLTGLEGHRLADFRQKLVEIKLLFVQFQLAGFDFREIKEVVDQEQERLAA